jgi:predicted small integral membrane protein
MLCRDCARGTPSRLYQVDPKSFAIAIPVTLAAALFGGWLMATVSHLGFFGAFIGLIYGLAVGEIALRLTGRKRGLLIELMAGGCVFAGLIGGMAIHTLTALATTPPELYSPDSAPMTATSLLLRLVLDPWIYVTIGVAVFGAISRIRNIG